MALQSTYSDTIAAGYKGLVANGETSNRITRTIETAGGIGFGVVAYRGAGDHGCVAAQTLVAAGSEDAGNTGTGTVTDAPTVSAGAKIGRYTLLLLQTSATGEYSVHDPDGVLVGSGNIASAFTGGGLAFTWANGGTMTIGDKAYVDVTGNEALGIVIAGQTAGLVAGQTTDTYARYENVPIMTQGVIWVEAGGSVTDGAAVQVDGDGNFVASGGIPLPGWKFDTTGADDGLVKIAKR
ncbi:structural cement protein Gp24 [Sphingomonas soli]|uniref:structural cement protein Gp24 n=1 Tax=Sphingomonas soli TaxID=266127 RepID=UPI0008310AA6|nr:hypothetical protein [Sphingomonas soli]